MKNADEATGAVCYEVLCERNGTCLYREQTVVVTCNKEILFMGIMD